MVSPLQDSSNTNRLMEVGIVTNVFEAVDVITLIKGGTYDELNLNVGEALQKRSDVSISLCLFASVLTIEIGFPRDLHLLY